MVFGAERDERFDWTRFDVIPNPDIDGDGILNEDDCDEKNAEVAVSKDSKACQLYQSGVPGEGILTAPVYRSHLIQTLGQLSTQERRIKFEF